jgi:hypothetical protein
VGAKFLTMRQEFTQHCLFILFVEYVEGTDKLGLGCVFEVVDVLRHDFAVDDQKPNLCRWEVRGGDAGVCNEEQRNGTESREQRAESREQRAEGRGQRAESREQRAESREQRVREKYSNSENSCIVAYLRDHIGYHEYSVYFWVWELEGGLLTLDVVGEDTGLAQLEDVLLDIHLRRCMV